MPSKPEIISRFKEQPKTRLTWWAMALGLATIFVMPALGTFAAVIRPIIDRVTSENFGAAFGFIFGIFQLALSLVALFFCVKAFKSGERSFVLWIGFVPSILISALWLAMIVGEFIFPH
ncbi:MAG: hypothetical protein NTW50_04120 [Candidatus Berkelbacteria bacterium]|nr:hypothetical protein [Candidatus Berkelbacteria bacterium]